MAEETYAFNRLGGAFQRTKNLLWPPGCGVWLRLAVIALFVGGGISIPNIFQYRSGSSDFMGGAAGPFPDIALVVVLIVAFVLAVALIWMFIGAVMQFIFVDMLSTGDIHIRRSFREHLGKGARLFLFEIVITAIIFLAVIALALALFGPVGAGTNAGAATLALLLVFIPIILIAALIFGLIFLLTTDFVVPIMIREDCGIIEGWRRLIGAISAGFWQVAIYIIVRFVLGLIAAIGQTILVIIALVIIAIPFVLIGVVLLAALSVANSVLLAVLLIPYLIIAIPVALLIAVPFITFFRYYALLVLEGLIPGYRLLPE